MSYFFRKDSVALPCREATLFSLDPAGPHFLASLFIPTTSPDILSFSPTRKPTRFNHAVSYNIDFALCRGDPWLWLNPVTTQGWSKTAMHPPNHLGTQTLPCEVLHLFLHQQCDSAPGSLCVQQLRGGGEENGQHLHWKHILECGWIISSQLSLARP